jgi:hypothetical protein
VSDSILSAIRGIPAITVARLLQLGEGHTAANWAKFRSSGY